VNNKSLIRASIALTIGLCIAGSATATNGYFTHGIGTKNKGQAGAGVAQPEEAIAMATNPASAALVGERMEIGAAIFSPMRGFETSPSLANGNGGAFTLGPNEVDSSREFFMIPHFAKTWSYGDDSALGVAFYGRGGMNTRYGADGSATFDPDGPGPAGPMTFPGAYGGGATGVDLSQALLDLTYARRVSETWTVGIAAVLAAQNFEIKGVGPFAPFTRTFAAAGGMAFPENLTNNGHELTFGAGLKVGIHGALTPRVSMAFSYQSEISMDEFDDYADIFAEQGGFDIPANIKFGLTFQPRENLSLSFDIENTAYSDVASVGNPLVNIFSCPTAGAGGSDLESCLGGDNGAGFGWDDMTTYKIGAQWNNGSDWTWRAGFSHGGQPIDESEVLFNILAPGVMENHITFGFTKPHGENNEWNVALMYAPEESVTGFNSFDPTQTIELEMYQWELEVSYGWK
jgi:long-chain fatty acid transport protein